jgi:hypothetical protein
MDVMDQMSIRHIIVLNVGLRIARRSRERKIRSVMNVSSIPVD